jgi:hypothetical protein
LRIIADGFAAETRGRPLVPAIRLAGRHARSRPISAIF